MNKKYGPCFALAFALCLTVLCYWKGLNGPFLFDDSPNLEAMGYLGGVQNWETFRAYVLSGWSGPTGRPISLISFLLNDYTWPSDPWSFKLTNLLLHLLCGLLLVWVTYLLLRSIQMSARQSAYLAVLSASLWMLHPLQVSTTLYVVQRMTVLAALFMLAGMVAYLKGRLWLRDPTRPTYQAYVLMTAGVSLGTLLAVLSKENGALLPLLTLVIEVFLRRLDGAKPRKLWVTIFLVIPSLGVLAYLASHVNFSQDLWPNRPFNQVERLYSESRIVWEYLRLLWLPRIEGLGLFQDGIVISRSITEPISTIWSIIAWVGVFLALPFFYRRLPFLWLGLVFFLCGHLIESTVLGLELYFEHRNYISSFFMFLPVTMLVPVVAKHAGKTLTLALCLGGVGLMSWMTFERSNLWSDEERLQAYWATENPKSARGRNFLISLLVKNQEYDKALALADQSLKDAPESSLVTILWLKIRVNTMQATPEQFKEAAQRLASQQFDPQTVKGLRGLIEDVADMESLAAYRLPALELVQSLGVNSPYKEFSLFRRFAAYAEGRLYLSIGDPKAALEKYLTALDQYKNASAAMQMFTEIAIAGYVQEASVFLNTIDAGIKNGSIGTTPLGKDHYLDEIARMRQQLIN